MSGAVDAQQGRGAQTTSPRGSLQVVAEFIVVGVCTLAFALNAAGLVTTLLTDKYAGDRDFISYWSAGHQLVQHLNPYDAPATLKLERAAGFAAGLPPLIMRNPPHALLLVFPLGFLGVRAASLLWSLVLVAALVFSVQTIAAMHGRSKSQLNVLAYSFAPALSCLIAGQMAILVLLGLVLFLRFHGTRPVLAGASLWLCALKPHLFLPFGLVLLVWVVATKSYKIVAGAAAAAGLSVVGLFLLDPRAWTQYSHAMKAEQLQTQIIPCLSMIVRWLVSPNSAWLQFLPAALSCLWALDYFRKHREHWDWMEHGSLLMLVSVMVAPYTWCLDQAVLLPALLHGLYRNRSRSLVAILALLSAAIAIGNFMGLPMRTLALYLWTAPAWLIWYVCVGYMAGRAGQPVAHGVTAVTEKV